MNGLTKTDWRAIGYRVNEGKCTPIFSDRLYSHFLPQFEALPTAWAKDIEYPLGRDVSLTRLAQYLSVTIGDNAAKEQYLIFVKTYFVAQKLGIPVDQAFKKFGKRLAQVPLAAVLNKTGIFKNSSEGVENPLAILAKLPIPVYITTSYYSFMEEALKEAGKKAQTEVCLWNEQLQRRSKGGNGNPLSALHQLLNYYFNDNELQDMCLELDVDYENLGGSGKSAKARELLKFMQRRQSLNQIVELGKQARPHVNWPDFMEMAANNLAAHWHTPALSSIFKQDSNYRPSKQNPLVFHLYGVETHPSSMVLTEDNYLDFLVQISQQRKLIPPWISSTLEHYSLLLLGYKIHDWDFRTLFRGLISSRRGSGREISIAIQLEPEENPEGVQTYFEQYFGDVEFKVFWGTTQDFLSEIMTYVG